MWKRATISVVLGAFALGGCETSEETEGPPTTPDASDAPDAAPDAPAADDASFADVAIPALADAASEDAAQPDPTVSEQTVVVFGDTHVHTRYSLDAFSFMALEGELQHDRDVLEACHYARYCSGLDFFVSSEHAEFLTPSTWVEVKDQVRRCNAETQALDGDGGFAAYTGFEWSQAPTVAGQDLPGLTDAQTWGHKVVFFEGDQEDQLPVRPIAAAQANQIDDALALGMDGGYFGRILSGDIPDNIEPIDDYLSLLSLSNCPDGVASDEIDTADCFEYAATPDVLFTKLSEWDLPTIVGAHGTAWGVGGPANWAPQVDPVHNWPEYQRFVEVYSKHGASEVYREWAPDRAWVRVLGDGTDEACTEGEPGCEHLCVTPPVGQTYLPCCWRRVELTLEHEVCRRPDGIACTEAVLDARRDGAHFVPHDDDEWRGCGECPDCFQPAAGYVPWGATQDGLVRAGAGAGGAAAAPMDVGFIGSTDTHHARPGSVMEHKPLAEMVAGLEIETAGNRGRPGVAEPQGQAINLLYTGGLAAVHLPAGTAPTRELIFDAMRRREVFATSGPRIWLWFHLIDGERTWPMGSAVDGLEGAPRFRVHATGAHRDRETCPQGGFAQMDDPDFVPDVCLGVCHNPDTDGPRLKILRLEIIRIRRQKSPDEPVGSLIDDVWRTLPCEGDTEGDGEADCRAEFEDPEFASLDRDVLYYVRAIQEETQAVNGRPLGCIEEGGTGCVETETCDLHDDAETCLSPTHERAWSSPIYIHK